MPTIHTSKLNRENSQLWSSRPGRVINRFDGWLASRGLPLKMTARRTGERFVEFAAEQEQAREIRSTRMKRARRTAA